MRFYSTNRRATPVDFREATLRGQAPDKGLYFPEKIPQLDSGFLGDMESMSNEDIAFRVILPYVGGCIEEKELFRIVSDTIRFPLPLVKVNEEIFSLELFHGPTLAFKDVGARFMSRCFGYFTKQENPNDRHVILVATSGDTGGAVADGFYEVEAVDAVILYPSGKVSPVQELQLTTYGKNIHALEVKGNFDDCQALVKQAFADEALRKKISLSSANSINIARWLPQQFYYFIAYKQWPDKGNPPVVSVPSGNFGNICSGLLAMRSGLPLRHFIAACNVNDVLTDYLETRKLHPRQAKPTLSNAMDVGHPNNFVRMLELFENDYFKVKDAVSPGHVTDQQTLETIQKVFARTGYLLDPHGAVGYYCLDHYLRNNREQKGLFLETAHPVKFPEAVKEATGREVPMPAHAGKLLGKKKLSYPLLPQYEALKDFLLKLAK